MAEWLDEALITAVDAAMAVVPRRTPPADRLGAARIISHRGERRSGVRENTFAAFDPLLRSGVWGIEFDIRYTADGIPVVFHDADLKRLYGRPERIADVDRDTLAALAPQVPTAADFIARYAPRFHLMVEIKSEPYPDAPAQVARLMQALGDNRPGTDYHLMSLDPPMLDHFVDVPESARISIARFDVDAISEHVIRRGQAAIGGHYALLTRSVVQRHLAAGQQLAIGFPRSRNSLFREIHRGAEWLFTNHALRMQAHLDRARKRAA